MAGDALGWVVMGAPVRVYISFAQEDVDACRQLEKHLSKLLKAGRIDIRHRRHVLAGQDEWAQRLLWLTQADLIIQLRTVNYEHDDSCAEETKLGAQRWMQRTARVIPVIVRAHDWQATQAHHALPLVLPRDGRPVESHQPPDEAWAHVAAEIRATVEEVENGRRAAMPGAVMMPPVPTPLPHGAETTMRPTGGSGGSKRAQRFLGALLLLFGGAKLYQFMSAEKPSATVPPPSIPVATPPTTQRPSLPVSVPLSMCATPCCGGSACIADAQNHQKYSTIEPTLCTQIGALCGQCQSGRACVAMSCGERLPREATYNLRLAHAVVNGTDPSFAARVCFKPRAASSWTDCVPYSSAAANATNPAATAPRPVPVKIGDMLTGNGLDVAIFEGQRPVTQYTFSQDNIKAAALCIGLKISPTIGDQNAYVMAFLDDP